MHANVIKQWSNCLAFKLCPQNFLNWPPVMPQKPQRWDCFWQWLYYFIRNWPFPSSFDKSKQIICDQRILYVKNLRWLLEQIVHKNQTVDNAHSPDLSLIDQNDNLGLHWFWMLEIVKIQNAFVAVKMQEIWLAVDIFSSYDMHLLFWIWLFLNFLRVQIPILHRRYSSQQVTHRISAQDIFLNTLLVVRLSKVKCKSLAYKTCVVAAVEIFQRKNCGHFSFECWIWAN